MNFGRESTLNEIKIFALNTKTTAIKMAEEQVKDEMTSEEMCTLIFLKGIVNGVEMIEEFVNEQMEKK